MCEYLRLHLLFTEVDMIVLFCMWDTHGIGCDKTTFLNVLNISRSLSFRFLHYAKNSSRICFIACIRIPIGSHVSEINRTLIIPFTVHGVKMQMWARVGSHHLSALLHFNRYPDKPDMTVNIPALKTPVNMDDNYGLRLTTYYRVRIRKWKNI